MRKKLRSPNKKGNHRNANMNNDAKASVIRKHKILQNNLDFRSKHQTLGAKVTLVAKPPSTKEINKMVL